MISHDEEENITMWGTRCTRRRRWWFIDKTMIKRQDQPREEEEGEDEMADPGTDTTDIQPSLSSPYGVSRTITKSIVAQK